MMFRGLTPAMKGALDRHTMGQAIPPRDFEEWLSDCCGAPPHEASPDVGEDNQAGICAQCREHTGFERGEE